MKSFIISLVLISMYACRQPDAQLQALQGQIDRLNAKLAAVYKPGFGEFMSSIQAHHAKLWFAGIHQNWRLADFEIHEIRETLDAIQNFETERDESKLTGMLIPAIDSVESAVKRKDTLLFRTSYLTLTNTCNNCHRASNFDFNVVKVPDVQLFSNQEFKTAE